MYLRIVNLKFASKIEADPIHAFKEYELLNKLSGILSIEVIRITKLYSIVINKFKSKKYAEES